MTLSDDDLRVLWRERSAYVPSGRSTCLTDSEWTRLLSKDADAQERARAATHIASCTACAEEYRLLQPLQSWAADVERVLSPPEVAHADRWTGWRAWWPAPGITLAVAAATVLLVTHGVMLSLLIDSRREKTQLETQLAQNNRRLSSSETSLTTLQEELRRETATKEQLNTLQQQRQAQLSTPQLDVAIANLEPRYAGVVRGSSDPQIVTTASNALTVTLILNFPPLASRSTLEIEVADRSGQVRWMGRTQRDQDTETLTLALPSAGYPAGEYVIRLIDVTRGRTRLASYPVVIQHIPERSR